MNQTVSITSQGQLTIPKSIRDKLGITVATKADIYEENGQLVVTPQKDFWSLAGNLKSPTKLTDQQLHQAREAFQTTWGQDD